jgi:hypothetical protein
LSRELRRKISRRDFSQLSRMVVVLGSTACKSLAKRFQAGRRSLASRAPVAFG